MFCWGSAGARVQCYHGYSVTMGTVLPWVQCYHGYSVTMVTVLPWLPCYHGYSVTMVTVLPWLQMDDPKKPAIMRGLH